VESPGYHLQEVNRGTGVLRLQLPHGGDFRLRGGQP